MGSEQYISEIDGKFSIDRIFNERKYNFGVFNNYDDALDKLDYLEEEGWPISKDVIEKDDLLDDLGLSLNNIEKIDEKYIIFKFINDEKVIFGEYDSIEEAKQIRNNLIDNAWESTEKNTRSKYGKYIIKDNNRFIVKRTYKGVLHTFGYYKTLDEALNRREELVSTNWGDLNISLEMKPGKYISYNGIMYTIQRMVDGKLNVYGFFNELDDAIKQRDWLVKHGWSKLEVPDNSKRHIHKNGNKYYIYKKSKDDIEYFGTFSSLEEAKQERNRLIENNWVLNSSENIEKISEYVYFDGEFYSIKREIDGQKRIYGVYRNKNQAISDEKSLIRYDWDGPFAIPTEEYPYGENIVPFDYIFILEKNDNGITEEIGTYYSFKDIVAAKNEILNNEHDEVDKLIFSVKVGKSYKNRGWSLIRDSTYDLVSKLPYEDNCDIVVDGIPTTGKLNLLPRIFYDKTDNVVQHLEKLANINPNDRINVELLLNKQAQVTSENEFELSYNEIFNLKKKKVELMDSVKELKEILVYMDNENKMFIEKFDKVNKLLTDLDSVDISYDELSTISNSDLRMKIFDMMDIIKSLKEDFNHN